MGKPHPALLLEFVPREIWPRHSIVSCTGRAWLAADILPRQYLHHPRHPGTRHEYRFHSAVWEAPKWQRRNWQVSIQRQPWSGFAQTYPAYIASRRPSSSSHESKPRNETAYGFGGSQFDETSQQRYPYSAIASCSLPLRCSRSVQVRGIVMSPVCSHQGQTSRPAATASQNPSDFVAGTSWPLSQYLQTILNDITSADTAAIENTKWSCATDCWASTPSGRAT